MGVVGQFEEAFLQGLKPTIILRVLPARLKSCPDTGRRFSVTFKPLTFKLTHYRDKRWMVFFVRNAKGGCFKRE
jgi:hypothetical protein